MPRCLIDHITITAPTLAAGITFVREALGVEPQPGGEHPRMGTHNRLLRLGEARFLEVIAIDLVAPGPGRPRWFALDSLGEQAPPTLDGAGPALIEWHTGAHPASGLKDYGLLLRRLEIFHPQPARVSNLLQSLQLDGPYVVSAGPAALLVAHIDTPGGTRRIGTPACGRRHTRQCIPTQ
jgi:hypothetical protein